MRNSQGTSQALLLRPSSQLDVEIHSLSPSPGEGPKSSLSL
uniref:Uncharacterized protein n=1 Tax=Amphimedon queenslandica TaxID=400682 RepID=A0A1X7VP78_AMPQE